MGQLELNANLTRPDDFYEALIEAHEPLTKPESDAFNARLILILANHIGESDVLFEALETAAASASPKRPEGQ